MVGPNSSFQYLRGGYQGARAIAELFTAVQGRMTREGRNRKKKKKQRFRLEKHFPMRKIKHCHRLSREIV